MTNPKFSLLAELTAEFLGTFVLILLGTGVVAAPPLPRCAAIQTPAACVCSDAPPWVATESADPTHPPTEQIHQSERNRGLAG